MSTIINGMGRVGIRNYVSPINPLWDNLLAYYRGDDTANDEKGNYNGTLVNGATYVTGKINNGFSFDGINDYITIPNIPYTSTSSPFSFSCWFNLTKNGTLYDNIEGGTLKGWNIWMSGGYIYVRLASGIYPSEIRTRTTNALSFNTMYHLTITYNGNTNASGVNIYINGLLVSKTTQFNNCTNVSLSPNSNFIGYGYFGITGGLIDDVGVWNRTLTAAEVAELYNDGAGKQYISPTPLWVGLTAYYTGDDTANDSKGIYNGTLVNGATYATGKIGSSFSFDGINDYMSTATNSPINSSLPHTYSCWVKASSNSGTKILMGNGTSMIGFRGGNNLTFFQYYVNAESNSNYSLAINTWYHISVVYKGTSFGANNVLFYVNGSLVYTGSLSMPSGVGKIYLGSNNAGSGGFYGGLIDEAGAWNRVLTAAEVTELYNAGAGKQYINQ